MSMTAELSEAELISFSQEQSEALLSTSYDYPFGEEVEVHRVGDKIFMLLSEHDGQPIVTLKGDPADLAHLVESFSSLSPGYHMNKKHWITVRVGEGVTRQLVKDLIGASYLRVWSSIPRARRPIGSVGA